MSSSKKKSDKVYDIGDNLRRQAKLSAAKISARYVAVDRINEKVTLC